MTEKARFFLIAGLGNPGPEYALSRHNAGFMAVDALAGPDDWKKERNYLIKHIMNGEKRVTFIKPQTFMNLSGAALGMVMTKYKIPLANVTVIHDDIDLKLGDVRTKTGGGNAGHNGLKSIDAAIGTNYNRIRIGVGRPEDPGYDIADWVLGKFAKTELSILEPIFKSLPSLLVI
ncbi:MAG: aminoacyl-tRNA hydrolase [Rickettsiales bacterium]|jgi:PTH1 family peptidyl-tRNA hydrolase|nr:aminoacyl-tRNA hydrolase [Rickettsiales bacterium]